MERTGFDHIEPDRRHQGGLGPAALPLLHPTTTAPTDDRPLLRYPRVALPIARASRPRSSPGSTRWPTPGSTRSAGSGRRRKLPTFDDLVFLTASVSRYPLEGYRERCETTHRARRSPRAKPIELAIPITIAGMSFGALSASAKEALGSGRHRGGNLDHHRGRRDDARGAQGVEPARLPGAALALRLRPRRSAPGRRHRDRHRPGSQARRGRDAARPEGERAGGGRCAPCRPASTSVRPAATPTGSGPTICGSRSRSSARPPTGGSRST